MPIKPIFQFVCILLLASMLAACGGTSATTQTPMPEVDTVVAWTFETMTAQAAANVTTGDPIATSTTTPADTPTATVAALPTNTAAPAAPVSTLIPTVFPAAILPVGSLGPYAPNYCDSLRYNFEQTLGVTVTEETAPFTDPRKGTTGTSCLIHVTGTGATLGVAGPFGIIVEMLKSYGWAEDINYGAGGPQTMMDGFRKGTALGILTYHWEPSADVNCPSGQPIGNCTLIPEQKLIDLKYEVVQPVVYLPLPSDQCSAWLGIIQNAVGVPMVQETVSFADLEGNIGTACRLRGAGTGVNFANMAIPSNNIINALTGWSMTNGADGVKGTTRELIKGNLVAMVHVSWEPSADVNCPTNQPLSACNIAPEQRLYTITVDFAQK